GFYECPDMFELPVDGDRSHAKWVLTAASSDYMLGRFDGERFTPETPKLPGNRGERFYTAQTFSGTADGRRVPIGRGQIETPEMPFNQMMSFPCELTLRTTPDGVRMFSWPIKEIEGLYGRSWLARGEEVAPGKPLRSEVRGELLDVSATVHVGDAKAIEW